MYKFKPIYFILIVLLFVSCGAKKTVVKKYYVIEYPGISNVDPLDTIPLISEYCRFADVEVYPAYATRQIANRNRSNEIQYYQNHEWAVRPQIFLNHLIVDYLENANVFSGIATRYWQVEPLYLFETRVYNLEVVQQSSELVAHVHLEFFLIQRPTNKTIVRHVADIKNPLPEKDLNLAASAMSEIFIQELEKVIQKVQASQLVNTDITINK